VIRNERRERKRFDGPSQCGTPEPGLPSAPAGSETRAERAIRCQRRDQTPLECPGLRCTAPRGMLAGRGSPTPTAQRIQTPINLSFGTIGEGVRARRRVPLRDRAYRDVRLVCVTGHRKWNGSPCRAGAGTRVERARWPHSLSGSLIEMSLDDSASSWWSIQTRIEPPPCPGTSVANGELRHRRASSVAPPPA
jgi:hypothetical protein